MNWIWPSISDTSSIRRALISAAMLPLFSAAYLTLLAFQQGSLVMSLGLSAMLLLLSLGIYWGSRAALGVTIGLLALLAFWQPWLLLPWLGMYLMVAYGWRASLAADRKKLGPDDFEPYLNAVGVWLWPTLDSGAAAARAVQRESLLVFWVALELLNLHLRGAQWSAAGLVLVLGALILFGLWRASRFAALAAILVLGALGPIFLPVFPLRPQHLLALPLAITGVRGAFAFHALRARDPQTHLQEEEGPTQVEISLGETKTFVDERAALS